MKKSKLGYILAYSAVFCAVGVLAANAAIQVISADSDTEVWGHYNAVDPTMDTDGSREYWISCSTHEIRFEEPTGANISINAAVTPNDTAISNFNDFRFVPRYNAGPGFIKYGEYPQSDASAFNSEIEASPSSADGYKIYQGNKYAKAADNNYYKFEPVIWKILDGSNPSMMLLLTNDILDAHRFDTTSNVYANSEIKTFLEEDFLDILCSTDTLIQPDPVSNSKIGLLSKNDYLNTDYGFVASNNAAPSRTAKVSDYAVGNGCYINNDSGDNNGNGWYWTSSPNSDTAVYYITSTGYIDVCLPTNANRCIRPAIRFNSDNNAFNIAHGYIPDYDSVTNTVTFGQYPQTVVTDPTIIANLANITPDANGYRFLDGENYVSLSANALYADYTFDNGSTIVNGTTYYFKVEPIVWKVLSNSNSTLSLVTEKTIDAYSFDSRKDNGTVTVEARNNYDGSDLTTCSQAVYPNNYKYSEIRKWLNETFINNIGVSANSILTTEVINGAQTTDNPSNIYACDNTNDKVYLLSYEDYLNTSYFSSSILRCSQPTDYAKANHVIVSTSGTYSGNTNCWTRSATSSYLDGAFYVNIDTGLYYSCVFNTYIGIRPGLRINIA